MSDPTLEAVPSLILALDRAVQAGSDVERCQQVKDALQAAVESRAVIVPCSLLRPVEEGYARRLLHRDPSGRYSVVVMVWGCGQGTALHDHAGRWCVECVYQGRVQVDNYSRQADRDSTRGICDFRLEESLITAVGDAGALIPPFEYHRISNPDASPSVTIHVYGGELEKCNAFEPHPDGGYVRVRKTLGYSPE